MQRDLKAEAAAAAGTALGIGHITAGVVAPVLTEATTALTGAGTKATEGPAGESICIISGLSVWYASCSDDHAAYTGGISTSSCNVCSENVASGLVLRKHIAHTPMGFNA